MTATTLLCALLVFSTVQTMAEPPLIVDFYVKATRPVENALKVEWSIADDDAILVLGIETQAEQQLEGLCESSYLSTGIVLLQSIKRTGGVTATWSRKYLTDYLGTENLAFKIWIIKKAELGIMRGDSSIKGGMHVYRTIEIRPAEAPSKLSFLCNEHCQILQDAFRDLPHFELKDIQAGEALRSTVRTYNQIAFLTLPL